MNIYLIIKSLLMISLLSAAFYLFGTKVKRLVTVMHSVDGECPAKPDQISKRIDVLFKDILGQTNVRRKKIPGWAHTLIFFGFLAVQPPFLGINGQGYCSSV